ncbi:apolipoprotein L4 [Silurus asotus]|uniref:Apolipoprotein L4 n=1 Tax=Silurus asotus TaxID=30991 RepID=A0AAD5AU51_SILAS|nr:apolipoprotein L4 [Silurus asotus]
MSALIFIIEREKLQEQLRDYILQSVKYTETLKEFCDGESKWTLQRETKLEMMRDIKDRAEQITLKFDHVQKSEDKAKAFGEYTWSSLTQFTADTKRQELEKELGEVLKNTLEGLEKLHCFLDAVEKLAVTSLFVFMGESFMPTGVSSMSVRSVISTARIVSPLLVHFKRDPRAFFLPSLNNVDVLAFQLDKYIRITQQICEKMEKKSRSISGSRGFHEWKTGKSSLKIHLNMSEESLQKLHDHLLQLTKIRMDESFRLTFLFDMKAQDFMFIFSTQHNRMLDFLSELEEAAVQLDKMKKGSNISTVAGSSVGIAGGVLSIVGLALAPVTAGASLALTLTGVGLGVTSGVNGIVTGITEMAVNKHHEKNAKNIFIRFMEDVQMILDCMEVAANAELEEAAVQLDKMKKGSNISTVAGSSVGIAGGVLSIVGLALAPVTAGASLALTLTGVGLGVTSGVNGIVTGITEMAVNKHHGQNANNIFIRFMEDVQMILDCIEEAASRYGSVPGGDGVSKDLKDEKQATKGAAGGNGIEDLVDGALPAKPIGPDDMVGAAVNVGLQEAKAVRNIPQLAADLPDIGQMAKGAPLALSKSARAGLIGLNVLFIGLDVLFICKDGISLAKGSKNEVAQIIRSRSVLWRSEVEAWQKIHDHLCEAMPSFYKNQEVLEQPFRP